MLYWVNCKKFCIGVIVDSSGIIINCAPIMKVFIGQEFKKLIARNRKFEGFFIVL